MNDLPERLAAFKLADPLPQEFVCVLSGTDLKISSGIESVRLGYKKTAGLYLWLMRYRGSAYKIYVGSTNCLSTRLHNYISDFQPHSPNDYKLRVFLAFILEQMPGATLDLYFSKRSCKGLKATEARAVATYRPLLNDLPKASQSTKQDFTKAFELYYRRAFTGKLRDDT